MSQITHFQATATLDLPETAQVAVPLGEVVSSVATQSVERSDGVEAGVWSCTPGRWVRQIMQQEFCHFIEGSCTFTPEGGEPIEIKAGDALMFPANCKGVWDIHTPVRKSYVLIFK